jgi:hypothetical protein
MDGHDPHDITGDAGRGDRFLRGTGDEFAQLSDKAVDITGV